MVLLSLSSSKTSIHEHLQKAISSFAAVAAAQAAGQSTREERAAAGRALLTQHRMAMAQQKRAREPVSRKDILYGHSAASSVTRFPVPVPHATPAPVHAVQLLLCRRVAALICRAFRALF